MRHPVAALSNRDKHQDRVRMRAARFPVSPASPCAVDVVFFPPQTYCHVFTNPTVQVFSLDPQTPPTMNLVAMFYRLHPPARDELEAS